MTLLLSLSIVTASFLSGCLDTPSPLRAFSTSESYTDLTGFPEYIASSDLEDSVVEQPESARKKYINDLVSLYSLSFPAYSRESSKMTAAQAAQGSFLRSELKRTMDIKLSNTDIKTLHRMAARYTIAQRLELDSASAAYDSVVRKISYLYMNKDLKHISEQGYNIFDLFMNELPPNPSTQVHLLRSGLVLIGHIKEERIVENAAPNQRGRYLIIKVDQVIKENDISRQRSGKALDTIILSPQSGAPIGLDIDDITSKDQNGRTRTYLFYLEEQGVGYCGFGPPVDPIVKHSPLYFLEFFPFEVSDSTISKVKASSSNRHTKSLKELRGIIRQLESLKGMKGGSRTVVR